MKWMLVHGTTTNPFFRIIVCQHLSNSVYRTHAFDIPCMLTIPSLFTMHTNNCHVSLSCYGLFSGAYFSKVPVMGPISIFLNVFLPITR